MFYYYIEAIKVFLLNLTKQILTKGDLDRQDEIGGEKKGIVSSMSCFKLRKGSGLYSKASSLKGRQ